MHAPARTRRAPRPSTAKLNKKLESMKEPSKDDADTIAQLMAGAGLCLSKLTQ